MAEYEKSMANSPQLPPTYADATNAGGEETVSLRPMEVTAHLKLLFAFAKLRESVVSSDDILGIDTSWLSGILGEHTPEFAEASRIIADKKWDIFVKRAALRFETWWLHLQKTMGSRKATIGDLCSRNPLWLTPTKNPAKPWMADQLPPLDVLMVWHSFLLSPRRYLEDCLLQGMMPLWQSEFPWAAIDAAIDPDLQSGFYDPGDLVISRFLDIRAWSNLQDECSKNFVCPHHSSFLGQNPAAGTIKVLCTTFDIELGKVMDQLHAGSMPPSQVIGALKAAVAKSKGWADEGFVARCQSCYRDLDNGVLCAAKFVNDIRRYQPHSSDRDRLTHFQPDRLEIRPPMPGTVLDPVTGTPQTCYALTDIAVVRKTEYFPIVMADTLCHVNTEGQPCSYTHWTYTMEDVRRKITDVLSCRKQMLWATNKRQGRANKRQRLTIRRLMSYYNDNPGIFTMDLASAVHRQSTFIQKMQEIDWLHSPTLSLTADRVITKYTRFMTVIADFPADMAVPTLDVDLAWHTHQLTPYAYCQYTTRRTGKFVDHDDKITEQKISESFARTSKHYQRLFQEPYSECTCWYCEAIHATISSFPGRFIIGSKATGYKRPENACDQDKAPHISTHNVIKVQLPEAAYQRKLAQHLHWLEKAYLRACERAKKEGRPNPPRRHLAATNTNGAISYDGFGVGKGGSTGKVLAVGAAGGLGLVAAGAIVISLDDDGYLDFGGDPQRIYPTGSGGCVSGTCGGGAGWGGCTSDNGGVSGACGGSGGSCSGGGGGGGCGGGGGGGGCGGGGGGCGGGGG